MPRPLLILGLLAAACAPCLTGVAAEPAPTHLEKANVLPLALDDSFSFRKQSIFFHDPKVVKQTHDLTMTFERQRVAYGAVTNEEKRARYGDYFAFWWRTQRPTNLKVRLEYRQANLGAYVQAQEVEVSAKKGTHETRFQVIGDDYNNDGRVTAWRALLVENGKIVALKQSFLWH